MEAAESDMNENAAQIPSFDCYLIAPSGRQFPSERGLLAAKSEVLKHMVLARKDAPSGRVLHFPMLGDSDEEVEMLWAWCHGKLRVVDEIRVSGLNDQVSMARLSALARMAGKYDARGECVPPHPDIVKPSTTKLNHGVTLAVAPYSGAVHWLAVDCRKLARRCKSTVRCDNAS